MDKNKKSNSTATKIRLITSGSGVGLQRDVDLVEQALLLYDASLHIEKVIAENNHWTHHVYEQVKSKAYIKPLAGLISMVDRMANKRNIESADITIFFQLIIPEFINRSSMNILIPNQEWVTPTTEYYLKYMDLILCKTKYAKSIFNQAGYPTEYLGFTSQDKLVEGVSKDYNAILHTPGNSQQKGTAHILDFWHQYNINQPLAITYTKHILPKQILGQVKLLQDTYDETLFMRIQNTYGIHLHPSEAEGFGHGIVEALSVGAVVITTDAPPMNEILTKDNGFVVKAHKSGNMGMGEKFRFDDEDMLAKLDHIFGLSQSEKELIGRAARSSYKNMDNNFKQNFNQVMQNLI